MPLKHSPVLLISLSWFALVLPAQAGMIFNADNTNVNGIENTVNGSTSQAFNAGVLDFSNTGSANYNGGIAGQQDIDTLLGRPLLDTETVVLRLTVDAIVGNLNANGFEFGISPNGTGFRPAGHAIFQVRPNNATASMAAGAFDGGGPAAFGLTEASVINGFTGVLTADQHGYTFVFSDVVLASGSSATYSGTFASPTQFRDTMGGGHFYATAQKTANPNPMVVSVSEASINVIPEPSSRCLLLLGLGLVLLARCPGVIFSA